MTTQTELFNSDALRVQPPLLTQVDNLAQLGSDVIRPGEIGRGRVSLSEYTTVDLSPATSLARGVRVVVTRGSWAGVEGVIHDVPAPDVPDRRYSVALDGYGVLAFGREQLERA